MFNYAHATATVKQRKEYPVHTAPSGSGTYRQVDVGHPGPRRRGIGCEYLLRWTWRSTMSVQVLAHDWILEHTIRVVFAIETGETGGQTGRFPLFTQVGR